MKLIIYLYHNDLIFDKFIFRIEISTKSINLKLFLPRPIVSYRLTIKV